MKSLREYIDIIDGKTVVNEVAGEPSYKWGTVPMMLTFAAIPGAAAVLTGNGLVGLGIVSLATALGVWLGNVADRPRNREIKEFGKQIYVPYKDGSPLTEQPVDGKTAAKIIKQSAERDHESKTQYTIFDTEKNRMSWRFDTKKAERIPADANRGADLDEGLRSSLAGAALAATTAVSPAAATETPSYQQQIAQAIQAGDVPRGTRYRARTLAGWVTQVTVDGQTYDIRDRIPPQGQRMMAAADQARQAMQEQELAEGEPEDPIARIDSLFRDS